KEKADLASGLQLNTSALQHRKTGTELLDVAGQALKDGRTAQAGELVKIALTNQYLTPADKIRAQMYNGQLRSAGKPAEAPASVAGAGLAPPEIPAPPSVPAAATPVLPATTAPAPLSPAPTAN